MRSPIAATCLLGACLAAGLQAQNQNTIFLLDGNPAVGGDNTFPWSQEGIRYQCIFTAAQLGSAPLFVNDLLVAPQLSMLTQTKTAVYDDIEIRMGMTAQANPTTDWATNNPNPTTVYRGPLRVTFEKGKWRGLGLPNAFFFLPTPATPNLCVEFIMWKFHPAHAGETRLIRAVTGTGSTRAYFYAWTTWQTNPPSVDGGAAKLGLVVNSGNFVPTETGCNSSVNTPLEIGSSTFPQAGKPFDITLSGALPASAAILAIGLSDTVGFGGTLPLDATLLNAPGCFLWNAPLAQAGTGVDGSGNAKLVFPIPNGLGFARVYVHWWNFDAAANALGITSSNYGKILLGN